MDGVEDEDGCIDPDPPAPVDTPPVDTPPVDTPPADTPPADAPDPTAAAEPATEPGSSQDARNNSESAPPAGHRPSN